MVRYIYLGDLMAATDLVICIVMTLNSWHGLGWDHMVRSHHPDLGILLMCIRTRCMYLGDGMGTTHWMNCTLTHLHPIIGIWRKCGLSHHQDIDMHLHWLGAAYLYLGEWTPTRHDLMISMNSIVKPKSGNSLKLQAILHQPEHSTNSIPTKPNYTWLVVMMESKRTMTCNSLFKLGIPSKYLTTDSVISQVWWNLKYSHHQDNTNLD